MFYCFLDKANNITRKKRLEVFFFLVFNEYTEKSNDEWDMGQIWGQKNLQRLRKITKNNLIGLDG